MALKSLKYPQVNLVSLFYREHKTRLIDFKMLWYEFCDG